MTTKQLIKSYKKAAKRLKKSKKILVEYKKLGYDRGKKLMGLAYIDEKRIEIDEGLSPKTKCFVLAHETCHICLPKATERQIERMEKMIGETFWSEGYRKVKKTS